jgi:DNA-binding NarL/FixJ family response regulator
MTAQIMDRSVISHGIYMQPLIRESRFTSGLPKVVVLHDHDFVTEVLAVLLHDQIDIVANTQSGKAAVALSELFVPDVVVLGETLLDGVSDHYVPALLQTGARALLVSQPLDTARLLSLVELGISGFVDSDHAAITLADAVLVLAAGGAVLPPDVVAIIATDWRRVRRGGAGETPGPELTPREREVLGAMSDGLSAKAVSHHLGISVKTVENHKTRIFEKLGVKSQAQAVSMMFAEGSRSHSKASSGDR